MAAEKESRAAAGAEPEVSLGQAIAILRPEARRIAAAAAAGVLLSAAAAFLWPKTWRAEALIMPAEESSDLLQTSFGALPAFAKGLAKGGPSATDRLLTILRSRTLAKQVIDGQNLAPLLAPGAWDEKRKAWKDEPPAEQALVDALRKDRLFAEETKLGSVKIQIEFRDPETATRIAEEYVRRLSVFVHETAITRAKRTRQFLGRQIEENQARLREAEATLVTFSEENRRVVLDRATAAMVTATSDLMTDIASKEMARLVLGNLLPEDDPKLVETRAEIARMRAELAKRAEVGGGSDKVSLPFEMVPALTLEYQRLKQDILILQQVRQLLQEEFEKARINEAAEELSFQVVDAPTLPDRPVRPRKLLVVAFGGAVSLALAAAFFLLRGLRRG